MKQLSTFFATLLSIGIILPSNSGFAQTIKYTQTGEEFSGPFPSWKNVKTVFGAKGDGVTNDAPAINAALLALQNSSKDSFNVLYFPAGTYLIDDSLYNPGSDYADMAIIGEDPATTIISWNGRSGGNMFELDGWYLRVSRLTFEGNNNAYRGIYKTGTFSTHCEFSDLVFKDFDSGIGLDFGAPNDGQAENAIVRCHFINCSAGISSCNYNSLDQWVWWCLFQNCRLAINQCTGYFQIYDNVFLNSSVYDIGSSPYKSVISGNTSINSKCFYNSNGTGSLLRGNKIYSNVDSFYTIAGSSVVMLDNTIRCTNDAYAITRTGSDNMFIGNTVSKISSQWYNWPIQPPYDEFDHGLGSNFNIGKQIEKAIDGNPATSFATIGVPGGIKWNCPVGTQRTVVKYTISAPVSSGGASPINFQLLGSNNWGYKWDILDYETNQSFTGGGNPISYPIKNTTRYSMYQLQSINSWQADNAGGRSIVNTGAESGTDCEQMVLAPFPRFVYQDLMTVHADTSYSVSGWMKSNAVVNNAYILVLWYDTLYPLNPSTGSPAGYIRADTVGTITGTTGWTYYSKTLTAPANALSAQVFLVDDWLATSSGTVWFDNFNFSSTKTPANNLLVDPGFESGMDPEEWFEVNEFTLLDSTGSDLTKDPNGFVSGADESWGQYYPLDNSIVDSSAIPVPDTISLPGTPQNMNRKIFEVIQGTGNDANEIQSKIDSAALQPAGSNPVVHIPFGFYTIKTTLTVPANIDMQIVGDGLGTGTNATTSLAWAGDTTGPLMLCLGPSRVTVKDLLLNVPYESYVGPEALEIEDADQVGGRIFGDQFNAGGPQWTQPCDIGLWANEIENSDITMVCFYPGFGNTAMVQATGGPILSSGGNTNGQISLLAGATGDCQNLFNVTDGGRIDAEGRWNEGDWARTSGLVNLDNTSGKLSIACMSWNLTPAYPMVSTNNFSGTFTFLLNHYNMEPQAYMPITGDGTDCNILGAYNDWGQANKIGGTTDSTWRDSTSPAANTDFIGNTSFNGALNVVVSKVQNVLPDSNSTLNELAQLRAVRTDPPNNMAAGVTDVKLFRVAAWGTAGHVAAEFNTIGEPAGIKIIAPNTSAFVSLYPNIVQQSYTVSYELPQDGPVSFTVYDILGREISQQYVVQTKGYYKQEFSATELSAGSYYLKFRSGSITETKKFIVVR